MRYLSLPAVRTNPRERLANAERVIRDSPDDFICTLYRRYITRRPKLTCNADEDSCNEKVTARILGGSHAAPPRAPAPRSASGNTELAGRVPGAGADDMRLANHMQGRSRKLISFGCLILGTPGELAYSPPSAQNHRPAQSGDTRRYVTSGVRGHEDTSDNSPEHTVDNVHYRVRGLTGKLADQV